MGNPLNNGIEPDTGEDEEKPFNPDWKPEDQEQPQEQEQEQEQQVEQEQDQEQEQERNESQVREAKLPTGMVPHGALHEERQRRKALEEQIERMENRFTEVLKTVAGPKTEKQEEVPEPNWDDDPIGALRAHNEKLQKRLDEIEARDRKAAEQNQQISKVNEFASTVAKQVNTFKKTVPDYDAAFQFVMERRIADLTATGMDENEARVILDAEAGFIAEQAMAKGKNPGEVVYGMAKSWGYKPKKADAEQQMDTVERGLKRSTPAGGGEPSLRDLANMGDDEFDSALKEMGFR